ncbi:MAG: sugar transferase [Lentimicrobiaceae bacterium]|nr:sugar transferase [Lentimicrobiaceae bacterium]
MNPKRYKFKFAAVDFISAMITWVLFSFIRKSNELWDFDSTIASLITDGNFFWGIILIPVFWLTIYYLIGTYEDLYRKARVQMLSQTFIAVVIGVVIIFFLFILDDLVDDYKRYYEYILILFAIQFTLTFIPRFIFISNTQSKIHNRKIGFRTVIVGSNGNAVSIYNDIQNQKKSTGNIIVGFVYAQTYPKYILEESMPNLGHYSELSRVIKEHNIDEVIIAIERSEQDTIEKIVAEVEDLSVVVNIIPEVEDILIGAVKTTSIYKTPLIRLDFNYMPFWQLKIKRLIDIFGSLVAIVLLSPVYAILAIGVRLSSEGPILYYQERIGFRGKPFNIPKFRSMYINSEQNGPALSSEGDKRITPFGLFMRKTRLDEIPQFFTVLVGKMSLVGPRPERQFFIDQIVKIAPHYKLLHRVKPGITSWGQVKYGYAENVDQMVERLKFDILYLENMTLAMDFKILFYTILTVIKGNGK